MGRALLLLSVLPAVLCTDMRFAWIRAIESGPSDTRYLLKPEQYLIDRQYLLPNGTELVGAVGTSLLAVATTAAQRGGRFHGCGVNHVNRIGLVLSSRCLVANIHFVGIERGRYPDSHPLCGGAPFQTPGCATPYCTNGLNASWLTFGGAPVRDSVLENVTIAGGTVQNAFWMPENPDQGYCENITVRNVVVNGSCARPGPCAPTSADGSGGGGTWADGINIHGAHRNVLIEGNRIPHSGDDGFALWSKGSLATGVAFRNNYAASMRYPRTWLASCFAMYGGNQSAFVDNTCVQSGSRGALYLAPSFNGAFIANVSFAKVAGNNFTRCCPISPQHAACGIHGAVQAPGCNQTRAEVLQTVLINMSSVINHISPLMLGAHFSPLNHQIQVLHSNLMFDESFEQTPLNGCTTAHGALCRCGSPGCHAVPRPDQYGNYQNHSWIGDPGSGHYLLQPPCASPEGTGPAANRCSYNGNVSYRLAPGGRVLNRGLYKQGFVVKAGEKLDGYLFARANGTSQLLLTLRDDGDTLASTTIDVFASNWSRYHFELTAARSTEPCREFPAGRPPLWCTCSEEECHTCIRCGGELAILHAEGRQPIDLDYVYVAPVDAVMSEEHLPTVNRLPVTVAQRIQPRMLRYGGTFSKCLHWKAFRGPIWLRQPYNDGVQSHAGSTRAFGFFETLGLCEALNITCVLGFSVNCGPDAGSAANLADFIEYAWGPTDGSSAWGSLREQDGHVAPYRLSHVQLGNEQQVAELVGTFAPKAMAMEARARQLGRAGELTFVLGSDMRSDSGASIVSDGNTSLVLQEIRAAGLCEQTVWDFHTIPSIDGYPQPGLDLFHLRQFKTVLDAADCPCRVAILEENLCQAHFTRALADAFTSNVLQRESLVVMQATSQLWSRAGNFNDGCGEGHIYTLPNMTWLSPPGWASQMIFSTFQPNALSVALASAACHPEGCLDVFAATSQSGKEMTIRIVNSGNKSQQIRFVLARSCRGFERCAPPRVSPNARLLSLTSPLSANQTLYVEQAGGVNPVWAPYQISTKDQNITDFDIDQPFAVPAQAFQVLTLKLCNTSQTCTNCTSHELCHG